MKRLLRLALLALSAWALAAGAPIPPAQPISIGETHTIVSVSLGERRAINVVLPASYSKSPEKRYPVLYLIDGGIGQDLLHIAGTVHLGATWGRSAEAIVVGIETKDRRRELTGPTRDPDLLKRYPTAGSSSAFRAFIRNEVKPLVKRTYRTDRQDAVLGESLAGLFILETYLDEPTLFGGFAAIDPSLWWDREALSRSAASKLAARGARPPLYIAVAKEQLGAPDALNRLIGAVGGVPQRWCLSAQPDLTHATIYQQMNPQALQFLLPPLERAPAEFGFEQHCAKPSSQQ